MHVCVNIATLILCDVTLLFVSTFKQCTTCLLTVFGG